MRKPTRLVEDATGRTKLKVSLSGGRYQLSLNDGADALFRDTLRLDIGEAVPEPSVPIVVATRDAWFPHEKDVDRIIDDLPTQGALTDDEYDALVSYVTSTLISPADKQRVVETVASSPIADNVDPSQLQVKELPSLPDGIDFGQSTSNRSIESEEQETSSCVTEDDTPANEQTTRSTEGKIDKKRGDSVPDAGREVFEALPGIGTKRAKLIRSAGVTTLEQLAKTRPSDLAEVPGLSYGIAMVAVEGARETVGSKQSTADRLSNETGADASTFEASLSQLAASGVPPSEAAPVLRTLFGPSVSNIEGVTGQQAYFLWRAGYRTPTDIVEASVTELCEVDQLGPKTAPKIKTEAEALLKQLAD